MDRRGLLVEGRITGKRETMRRWSEMTRIYGNRCREMMK
jgi:hypothetical protein